MGHALYVFVWSILFEVVLLQFGVLLHAERLDVHWYSSAALNALLPIVRYLRNVHHYMFLYYM